MDAFSKGWGNELFSPHFCLDGFMVVAVTGKRPRVAFSITREVLSEPWRSLGDIPGQSSWSLSKQTWSSRWASPPCHHTCHKYFFLYTCTHIFPLIKNASLSHITSFLFRASDPMSSLSETVPGYFSPKEWPLVWPVLPRMSLSGDASMFSIYFLMHIASSLGRGSLQDWMITFRRKVKKIGTVFEHREEHLQVRFASWGN